MKIKFSFHIKFEPSKATYQFFSPESNKNHQNYNYFAAVKGHSYMVEIDVVNVPVNFAEISAS